MTERIIKLDSNCSPFPNNLDIISLGNEVSISFATNTPKVYSLLLETDTKETPTQKIITSWKKSKEDQQLDDIKRTTISYKGNETVNFLRFYDSKILLLAEKLLYFFDVFGYRLCFKEIQQLEQNSSINCICWFEDLLYFGSSNGFVLVYKSIDGGSSIEFCQSFRVSETKSDQVVGIDNYRNTLLITSHSSGMLKLWRLDPEIQERLSDLKGNGIPLIFVRFIDHETIVCGSSAGKIIFYNFQDKFLPIAEIDAHAGWISGFDIYRPSNSNEILLSSCGEDSCMYVWKIKQGISKISLLCSTQLTSVIPYGVKFISNSLICLIGFGSEKNLRLFSLD